MRARSGCQVYVCLGNQTASGTLVVKSKPTVSQTHQVCSQNSRSIAFIVVIVIVIISSTSIISTFIIIIIIIYIYNIILIIRILNW